MSDLFRHPFLLAWLAAGFAALAWFLSGAEDRRRELARRVLGAAAEAWQAGPAAARRLLRYRLALAALALGLAAAAGPQWGVELAPASDLSGNIVVAVDASLSMAARDLKPSRMEHARLLLGALTDHFAEYRVGVIAFAGAAYTQCPLTTDADAVRYFASALAPGMLPSQGTDFEAAVRSALGMLSRYGGQKVLVLVTDGETHSRDLDAALEEAAAANLKIFTVGLGTPDGELIPVTDSYGNTMEYKKDGAGKTVVSKLDEATLIKMAARTGAAYLRYSSPDETAGAVRRAVEGLDLEKAAGRGRVSFKDRYQWPLAAAILLLLIELCLMERGWNLKLSVGRKLPLLLLLPALAAAPGEARAAGAGLARKGNSAYDREDWAKAYEYYSRASQEDPRDPRHYYNLGAAFYRLEDYGKAREAFEAAGTGKDLGPKAGYNRANALYRAGDTAGAIQGWRGVLQAAPADENALFNLQKALEKQKQNQCQNPQDKKDDKKKGGEGDKDKQKGKGGGGDKDKSGGGAGAQEKKEQERRKAEARERARQILQMMKEKEKDSAKGAKQALRSLQKGKPPEPPKGEDW